VNDLIIDYQFISGWYIEDNSICDSLIDLWKNSDKQIGTVNINGSSIIDKNYKDSIEVKIHPNSDNFYFLKYLDELRIIAKKYITQYPWSDKFSPWSITDSVNLQYYPPNGGFKSWHTERSSATHPFASRHLVFMTYLNDVWEGGETEFYHQNLKVSPKKGLTLIWPSDWTHLHRGLVSKTQEKWIITGWFNFLN
jgi:hypothetical protein|tara:strand:- start:2936 stop:3520 length:585 start_codon:yes stop_codon:yes gene_type:complete